MKKLFYLVALSSTFLVMLSGCALLNNTNTSEGDNSQEATSADTNLDNKLFSDAVGANDKTACAMISTAEKKTECEQVIDANIITQKAVETTDKNLCGDIELTRYAEYCTKSVEDATTNKAALEKAQKEYQAKDAQRLAIEEQAVESGNANICDQIENKGQISSCKYNVLANKAGAENNPSLCDGIGDEVLIESCKEFAAASQEE